MSEIYKRLKNIDVFLMILSDAFLVGCSYAVAFVLSNQKQVSHSSLIIGFALALFTYVCFLTAFGTYKKLWFYSRNKDLAECYFISIAAGLLFLCGNAVLREFEFDFVVWFIMLASVALTGEKIILSMLKPVKKTSPEGQTVEKKKVLLVGAGQAAMMLIEELRHNSKIGMEIVCAVDDSPEKIGRRIDMIEIAGTTGMIPELCTRFEPDIILVAIPSIDNQNKKRILKICASLDCEVRIMEDVYSFMLHSGSIADKIRKVSLNDLLGRDTVYLNDHINLSYISGQTVLVTGGGGSIGSELCRQIAIHSPKKLIVLDIYENNAYEIQQELIRKHGSSLNMQVEICSVRDLDRLERVFAAEQPTLVFHAAAHKHVPFMEHNPEEAVKNNVIGTYNTALCADKYHVKKFILVSTDKAVNPTNFMGASKRCAEMIIQRMAMRSGTVFAAVRFGNVIGSNGSVIPLFKKQIEEGGPVTVTHPEMIRYFMTIFEASQLVIKAGDLANSGEIFVLDMGEPVKILDLAENLIRLVGLRPYKDIAITFTGLRPGEKLYEELLLKREEYTRTENNKIYVAKPVTESLDAVFENIEDLKYAAESYDVDALFRIMSLIVPSYKPWHTKKAVTTNVPI